MAKNRAATRGTTVSADVQKLATTSQKDVPKDLADAGTQWKILNPETLRYELQLEGDPRVIEIKTIFTLADEMNRRVYENIEAFRQLLGIEIMRYNPDFRSGSRVDWTWINEHKEYFDPALMLSHVRARARQILASISSFVDEDEARAAQRVTEHHLELGMDQIQLAAAMLFVNNAAFQQIETRKKASAAKAARV